MRLGLSNKITQPRIVASDIAPDPVDLNLTVTDSSEGGDLRVVRRRLYASIGDTNYYTIQFPNDFYTTGDDPFVRDENNKINEAYNITLTFPSGNRYGNNDSFIIGYLIMHKPAIHMILDETEWTPYALKYLTVTIENSATIMGSGGWGGPGGQSSKSFNGGGGGGGGGVHPVPSTISYWQWGTNSAHKPRNTTISNSLYPHYASPPSWHLWWGAGGIGGLDSSNTPSTWGNVGGHGDHTAGGSGGASKTTTSSFATANRGTPQPGGAPFFYTFEADVSHDEQPTVVINNRSGGTIKSGGGGGGGSHAGPGTTPPGAGGNGGAPGNAGDDSATWLGSDGADAGLLKWEFVGSYLLPAGNSSTTAKDWTFFNDGSTNSVKSHDVSSFPSGTTVYT